jgi:AraC-like DNA-binding protein
VHLWSVTANRDDVRHTVAPGFGHSLLAPLQTYVFERLGVAAAVWQSGPHWFPIHAQPNVSAFEAEHGKDGERGAYNGRCFAAVLREKKILRGEHAGYSDLFVPLVVRGRVVGVLTTGPFALARPTSVDVLERWRWLTGRQGHPADPEFASYLSTVLSTLVLSGDQVRAFEDLLGCFAALLTGQGDAGELKTRAGRRQIGLGEVRLAERTWEAAREMVDERSAHVWEGVHHAYGLVGLGLSHVPDHVLVGLTVDRSSGRDPVGEAIRRDAFQRETVEVARRTGNTIAGCVGDHGIVLLSSAPGSPERKTQRLGALSERVALIAKTRFALDVYFGASSSAEQVPLSTRYQAALGAAEAALMRGVPIQIAEAAAKRPPHSLRNLREQLAGGVEERPSLLRARFDRYLEAAAMHSGYRIDLTRTHLEVGFERLTQPLLDAGTLDRKSYDALCETLDRAAAPARTMNELFAAYRTAVADVADALERPASAGHDRSLRRAIDYIREHYCETLSFPKVARVAGFTPNYFSKLFRAREKMTFERYVRALRVERAKQLLSGGDLAVTRVARLSGFRSLEYFARVFRQSEGTTPLGYRRRRSSSVQ